jgi:hypothetical protein
MIFVTLPLKIESVANKREHWAVRAKRSKAHRKAAIIIPKFPLPCQVVLVRIAPRELDTDNLQSGFKALRDGIADRLGVKDNDPRVEWIYEQKRGAPREYKVDVSLWPMP